MAAESPCAATDGHKECMDKRLERGLNTRAQLVATATRLFTERGYEATSIELVLQEADTSRGSLYYHFAHKEALFEAVLDEVEAHVAEDNMNAARGIRDPVEALYAGCANFLRLAADPTVRQIVLLDAPTAVGWQRWREIDERHAFGRLKLGVQAIHQHRPLAAPPDVLAHVLLAALIELAMLVARADPPADAIAEAETTLRLLIERMLGTGDRHGEGPHQ